MFFIDNKVLYYYLWIYLIYFIIYGKRRTICLDTYVRYIFQCFDFKSGTLCIYDSYYLYFDSLWISITLLYYLWIHPSLKLKVSLHIVYLKIESNIIGLILSLYVQKTIHLTSDFILVQCFKVPTHNAFINSTGWCSTFSTPYH